MESAGRIIGFDGQLMVDLGMQIISTVMVLGLFIMMIYICILAIKALRIYIKKNS